MNFCDPTAGKAKTSSPAYQFRELVYTRFSERTYLTKQGREAKEGGIQCRHLVSTQTHEYKNTQQGRKGAKKLEGQAKHNEMVRRQYLTPLDTGIS